MPPRLFQVRLPEHVAQGSRWHIDTESTRYRDRSRLVRMLELTVASPRSHLRPAIAFEQLYQLANLHGATRRRRRHDDVSDRLAARRPGRLCPQALKAQGRRLLWATCPATKASPMKLAQKGAGELTNRRALRMTSHRRRVLPRPLPRKRQRRDHAPARTGHAASGRRRGRRRQGTARQRRANATPRPDQPVHARHNPRSRTAGSSLSR